MNHERSVRPLPLTILGVASAASLGYGVWLTSDKITTMETALIDGSATGVEVYGGQSWAVFAAAFVVAGLIGLLAVLALLALPSRRATETSTVIAGAPHEVTDSPVAVATTDDAVEATSSVETVPETETAAVPSRHAELADAPRN